MVDWKIDAGPGSRIEIILMDFDQPPFLCGLMADFMVGVQSSGIGAGQNLPFRSDEVNIFFTDIFDGVDDLGCQIFADLIHGLVPPYLLLLRFSGISIPWIWSYRTYLSCVIIENMFLRTYFFVKKTVKIKKKIREADYEDCNGD